MNAQSAHRERTYDVASPFFSQLFSRLLRAFCRLSWMLSADSEVPALSLRAKVTRRGVEEDSALSGDVWDELARLVVWARGIWDPCGEPSWNNACNASRSASAVCVSVRMGCGRRAWCVIGVRGGDMPLLCLALWSCCGYGWLR